MAAAAASQAVGLGGYTTAGIDPFAREFGGDKDNFDLGGGGYGTFIAVFAMTEDAGKSLPTPMGCSGTG